MAVTFETYQKAAAAVKSGKAPEDVLGGLMDIIDEYEKGHQEGFAAGSTDVPTPEQMGAKNATQLAPGAFDVPTAAQVGEREGQARALNAPVAKALKLREGMSGQGGGQSHLSQEPPKPWEVTPQHKPEDYDESLPTASHRKEAPFVAPPEYIPPPKAQPLDFWGHLNDAALILPRHKDGGAEHFFEPSIEQFRKDMAPAYGERVMKIDEFSPEYQEYSDKLWKDIYDQAVAQGRPVIREKFKRRNGIVDTLEGMGWKGAQQATAAAHGVSEALPFNFPERITNAIGATNAENQEKVASAAPLAHDVGFAAGAVAPFSTGNIALKAAGAVTPGVVGDLAASLPNAVRIAGHNAAAGYISGWAQSLGTDLARGDRAGALGRANKAGFIGIPLAVGGGLLTHGLQNEAAALRREGPLGEAGGIGATPSVLRGVKPGPTVEKLRGQARELGLGPEAQPDVESMLVARAEEPMVAEGRRQRAAGEARVGTALEQFHKINAGEYRSPERYIRALSDLHENLVDAKGNPLPENGPIVGQLRRKLGELADIELVPKLPKEQVTEFNRRVARNQSEEEIRAQERLTEGPQFETSDPFAEAEATNPGGRAVMGDRTTPDQVTPIGINDLELPKGASVPPREASPHPYDRVTTRLRQIEKETPGAFRLNTASQVVREGFDLDRAVAEATGMSVSDVRAERAAGRNWGDDFDFIMVPRKFNPGQHHQIVAGVNEANKEGAQTPPDPRLARGTSRAIREDRDQFTGSSPEIPRDLEYTVKDEQGNPITLRGYSAFEAKSADELAALKRKLSLAGLPENPPEELTGPQVKTLHGALRQHGRAGQSPEAMQAQLDLARSGDQAQFHPYSAELALDDMRRMRAVAELEKAVKITQMFRGYGGALNPVERMSALGLRVRMDPLLQWLQPKLGGLGAAGATIPQTEHRSQLPAGADQTTIDQISKLLGMGP